MIRVQMQQQRAITLVEYDLGRVQQRAIIRSFDSLLYAEQQLVLAAADPVRQKSACLRRLPEPCCSGDTNIVYPAHMQHLLPHALSQVGLPC